MHIALVQLALESQAYEEASPVLDHNVLYIPAIFPSPRAQSVSSHSLSGHQFITLESRLTQRLKPQEVLEYFTLGGTVYIGLRQWDRALDMLETAITYPVKDNATSKIMAEAYKKWSLVNVVLNGKPGALPSTVNGNAAKNFHVLAKPYDTVASLFESATASRLKEEIEVGHEIWRQDRNSGLMNCVLAAHQEFQIRNLATLYRTISIPTITQTTVSAETGTNLPDNRATETLIMGMISRGDLDATIHRPQGEPAFLSFESSAPVLSESDVDRQLIRSLEMIKSMTEDIKNTDQQLTHDKEYLKWAHRQKKTVGAVNDMFAGEELGWSNNPDEDLMAP
jgi:COP9 signalosome complex subunit 3